MNTKGNTIFISGGSAGIGLEIAKLFSEKGNKVIINGRNRERLDKALRQLKNAVAIQGDLSVESERIRVAEELKQHHPQVNVIINNAAEAYIYSLDGNGEDSAYAHATKEITTNYLAVIHFTELLLPLLKEKSRAAVVNVTSIASLRPAAVIPTYSASKAALHFYTLSLRKSLSETNVGVYELIPPMVNTEFSAGIGGATNGIPPEEVAEELLAGLEDNRFEIPVGKTKAVHTVLEEAFAQFQS
ncbi:SDR family NAD(P)-dependent oxidoreductase [Paraflavisolibacter sp. H34]|uniref:SDR family oxidoreductase n=1 Tax=Huijunlia imazamoxiresistens TaxID=3127457 RepID=UPI0030163132